MDINNTLNITNTEHFTKLRRGGITTQKHALYTFLHVAFADTISYYKNACSSCMCRVAMLDAPMTKAARTNSLPEINVAVYKSDS